jgi:hypothetical protein
VHKPKELSWEEAAGVPEVCPWNPPLSKYILMLIP